MIVCINTNTMAVSEYDLTVLDVFGNNVITETALSEFNDLGLEVVESELKTGLLHLENDADKRCASVAIVTSALNTPAVHVIDDELTEYATSVRRGYSNKYSRTYDAPRGVATPRIGFAVRGEGLAFRDIKPEIALRGSRQHL